MKSLYSISLGIRLSGALLAALGVWLLARSLSPEELGVYSGIIAITTVLALPSSAGLPMFLTREIARKREQDEPEGIRPLINAGLRVWAVLSLLAVAIFIIVSLFDVFPRSNWAQTLILVLTIPLLSLDLIRSGTMRGMASAVKSQLPETLIRPASFLIFVVAQLIIFGQIELTTAFLAFFASCLCSAVTGQYMLAPYLKNLPAGQRVPIREVTNQSMGIAVLGATNTLIGNLDLLILSLLGMFVAAGEYRIALQGVVALLLVHNTVSTVGLRDLASANGRDDRKALQAASDRITLHTTLGTTAVWVAILLSGNYIIEFLFGSEYSQAYSILLILGVGFVVNSALGPGQDLLVLNMNQKNALVTNLASIAFSIVLAFLLIPELSGSGMAIASASGLIMRKVSMARLVSVRMNFNSTIIGTLARR